MFNQSAYIYFMVFMVLTVCFLCHICPTLRNPPHYLFSVCSRFIIFFCFGNFLHTSVLFSSPYLISSSFIVGPTASVPSFILDIFAFSLAHLGDRSRFILFWFIQQRPWQFTANGVSWVSFTLCLIVAWSFHCDRELENSGAVNSFSLCSLL